jgi:signal transduction histidine kinase
LTDLASIRGGRAGHGYLNMADRLGSVGGTIRWKPEPSYGSEMIGSIPLS